MLISGNISFNDLILKNKNDFHLSLLIITFLHEMAHANRFFYASQQFYFKRTPEIYNNECGEHLEEQIFGKKIQSKDLDEDTISKILNIESWKKFKFLTEE